MENYYKKHSNTLSAKIHAKLLSELAGMKNGRYIAVKRVDFSTILFMKNMDKIVFGDSYVWRKDPNVIIALEFELLSKILTETMPLEVYSKNINLVEDEEVEILELVDDYIEYLNDNASKIDKMIDGERTEKKVIEAILKFCINESEELIKKIYPEHVNDEYIH